MKNFYKLIANGFGSGLLPLAPGTWGSAVACLFVWPLMWVAPPVAYLILTVLIVVFSWLCVKAVDLFEPEWGKDPGKVVADEMVGMWLTLVGLPLNLVNIGLGFALFRFFDIAKPMGIRRMEAIPGGWGVVLDDVMAGVYANILLQVLNLLLTQ
ncbi:MAG: phosphatidylglycerophosphatase A [Lewinellaceae bacterium]|jgi:phosphatidylglycerophosphatase A|nr:phosphatidylglycerophosphatase A [Lewinellaceae bacterium]